MSRLVQRLHRGDESGFTLVEMLVAMLIFSIVAGVMMTTTLGAKKSASTTKAVDDANEEARLALNRMSREFRQASYISAAQLYSTGPQAGYAYSITFGVDFNGDGTINPNAVDPEVLTYRYVAAANGNGQIQLEANDPSGNSVVRPILAGNVSAFQMALQSSQWACDIDGNGVTTWQELDTNTAALCPHPDNNGVLDANELQQLDGVVISFTVFEGSHAQNYRAKIDLRNVGISSTSGN